MDRQTAKTETPKPVQLFVSDDHCHICGVMFTSDEMCYAMEAVEIKPTEDPKPFLVVAHPDCLRKGYTH